MPSLCTGVASRKVCKNNYPPGALSGPDEELSGPDDTCARPPAHAPARCLCAIQAQGFRAATAAALGDGRGTAIARPQGMRSPSLLCAALLPGLLSALGCSSAPAAQAAPAAESCATCHVELSPRLRDPVLRFQAGDVHVSAGLTCSSCHAGDPTARDARTAHAGRGFVADPNGGDAVVAMCGRCHVKPAENFLKGPHHLAPETASATASRRPDCATCHGGHGILTASIGLIAEPLCSSCHTVPQARRIFKALNDAEREVGALDLQLSALGDNSADRARLKTARSQLRGLSHALDLFAVTRTAAQTLEVVDDVRAKAMPRLSGKDWGRRLRIAGLILAGLMAIAAAAWGARALRARKLKLPVPRGRELVLLSAVAGVLAVAAVAGSYRAYHYIEHDPKFCLSCHTMNSAYALWEMSGHKKIDCHVCHLPDLASNLHQIWFYTTRRPDAVVKHAEVDRSVCERCHAGGGNSSKWNHVVETPGHRVHVGRERIECIQCHSMSVHRFVPPKETCATCHKKATLVAAGTMAEMHCLQCHPFLADDAKRPLKPDRAACLDCHERRQVAGEIFPAKAPMRWDCGKCHKPHEKLYLGTADCFSCHNTMTEGVHRMRGHGQCLDCHKPHGWSTAAASCTGCHANIVPAKHHLTPGKSCKDCHGAWDDEFLPKAKPALKAKLASK